MNCNGHEIYTTLCLSLCWLSRRNYFTSKASTLIPRLYFLLIACKLILIIEIFKRCMDDGFVLQQKLLILTLISLERFLISIIYWNLLAKKGKLVRSKNVMYIYKFQTFQYSIISHQNRQFETDIVYKEADLNNYQNYFSCHS